MTERYTRLKQGIQEAVHEKPKRDALYYAMKRGRDSRRTAIGDLPGGETFRQEVRDTKLRCIADQDVLVERFAENARKRGAKVFRAKDGNAAIAYVLRLAAERNAKTVAKSKSLTTEEIEINHPLEDAGMRVIETDLGELIIQLVDEKPYHLVFPAVHKTAEEVSKIFTDAMGEDVPSDIPTIMRKVREYLRPIFLNADIGMTGANIGVAENGAIVIETNEGNGRLVSAIGDCHVCVVGMEKIVESVDDALLMVLAHPISAIGQLTTTYVTWMAGRSPLGEGERVMPRDSHIIILDNGRTEMRDNPVMSDALNCIRCGACMNICPTYGVVGGHTFGHIYPGPIGIPWTSEVHGLEKAGDFAPLCISCGLCKEICPAKIDIPMMIADVKHRDAETHPHPQVNKALMQAEGFAKFGSATAPVSNWFLNNGLFRGVLEKAVGIDRRRNLPPFARDTFDKRFGRRPKKSGSRKVAYFVDIYANYNAPELGIGVVDHLEQLDCEVIVPPQRSSGYPYIGYGDLDKARECAEYNVSRLASVVRDGYTIVASEPTAAYCLMVSYTKLLPESEDAKLVAAHTRELFNYLLEIEGDDLAQTWAGKRFGFHCSCHQRPMGSGDEAQEWLRRRGAEVEFVQTGTCCGMGGTFGLKAGELGYDLSQAVGEPLFQAFADAKVDTIVTESSVCKIQLLEGTGLPVWHPLQLLLQVED
jgi:iron-sulfur cluster protein